MDTNDVKAAIQAMDRETLEAKYFVAMELNSMQFQILRTLSSDASSGSERARARESVRALMRDIEETIEANRGK